MDELKLLQIETTNNCQSKCVFCLHKDFKEYGDMTDELYTKILEEAADVKSLTKLIPMGTGEPFCDTKILERVKQICETLPKVKIVIYTNGGLLTEAILDELNNMNGHIHLMISLNALTADTRFKLMGLNDFDHVMDMVKYIDKKTLLPYCLSMVNHPLIPDKEKVAFKAAGGWLIRYWSWAGKLFDYMRPEGTICPRPIECMFIRYTGQATLCCCDMFGEITMGDLTTYTVKEVWASKIRQYYARAHWTNIAHRLPMCENCGGGKKFSSLKKT